MSGAAHDRVGRGDEPVPVTILGGYLGSGKTTRINELLASWEGDPLAVVVNDFGAVNIDAALTRAQDGDTLELQNGCVCCTLSDGMAQVMTQLGQRARRPAHVVVEVSGVGDPAGVARWARLPGFTLNGVVVCADVESVRRRAADRWVADTVQAQLRSADLLLLTKTDLVGPQQREEVEAWLRATAPGARVASDPRTLPLVLDAGEPLPASPDRAAEGRHDPDDHRSWMVSTEAVVDLERVAATLAALPETVVRVKGVLRTRQAPSRRTVLQQVGRRVEVREDGDWRPGERSTLVLIATGAPHGGSDLAAAVQAALDGPATG